MQALSHLGGQRLSLCLLRGQGAGGTGVQGLLQVEQAQTLGSEAEIEEGVEEGVEAAVDVGQAGGVRVSQEQEAQEGAGVREEAQVGQGVGALHHMEGHPAGGEDHHQRGDDLQQPPLPLVLFAQRVEVARYRAADEAVTHHHGQERQEEAQQGGGDAEAGDPQVLLLLVGHHQAEVHGAGRAVAAHVVLGGAEDQSRGSQENRQQPDDHQGGLSVAPGTQLSAGQGVHDGQVAVVAHAGQAEHACIHVEQDYVAADLAQGHSEGPVVAHGGVNSPQRQRDHEGEVSQGQIANIDVCRPPLTLGPPHGEDDHAVSREAQDENEHVEHGDDGVRRRPLRVVTQGGVLHLLVVVVLVRSFGWIHVVSLAQSGQIDPQQLSVAACESSLTLYTHPPGFHPPRTAPASLLPSHSAFLPSALKKALVHCAHVSRPSLDNIITINNNRRESL